MNLENVIAISGFPGLYKVVSQTNNGIVVESLETKKRMPAYATHKVSALEDISIYTDSADVPLKEVFLKMFDVAKGKKHFDKKASNDELKAFFGEALPDYDKDRVYSSDIKKVVKWYNSLLDANLIEAPKEEKKTKAKETAKKKAPTKKTAAKKD